LSNHIDAATDAVSENIGAWAPEMDRIENPRPNERLWDVVEN